jgi:plastocyanin
MTVVSRMKFAVTMATILAACGSGDDGTTQKDAAGSGSGSNVTATVSVVACTGTPPVVSTDSDTAMHYTYSTTTPPSITVGSMVHFMMTPAHNVIPSLTLATDPGLKVGFGADVCLKFTKAGTFNFVCMTHGFAGSVTVQ